TRCAPPCTWTRCKPACSCTSRPPHPRVPRRQPAAASPEACASYGCGTRTAPPSSSLFKFVDQDAIIQYITDTFAGVEVQRPTDGPGAGDTFFFYDPQRNIDPQRRLPFATIVVKDYGDFDNASNLNRADVFRLNIGVSRDTFRALVGHAPGETSAAVANYDFAALDRLMPHPVYAPQSWL